MPLESQFDRNDRFKPASDKNTVKEESNTECNICCENISIFARYSCNHEICHRCSARLLFLYNNNVCPICKRVKNKPYFHRLINIKTNFSDKLTGDIASNIKNISDDNVVSIINSTNVINNIKNKFSDKLTGDITNNIKSISNDNVVSTINSKNVISNINTKPEGKMTEKLLGNIISNIKNISDDNIVNTINSTNVISNINTNQNSKIKKIIKSSDETKSNINKEMKDKNIHFNNQIINTNFETSMVNHIDSKRRKAIEDKMAFYENLEIKKIIENLISIRCIKCQSNFDSKKDLEVHFKKNHNLFLCITCLDNNHDFWDEIKSYTVQELISHRKGIGSKLYCHIYCPFCSVYLYDKTAVITHCNQNHQICTVCDVLGNRRNFYRDYSSLQEHYRSQHFCCTNSNCVKDLCYVFPTRSELWAHYLGKHNTEIPLNRLTISNIHNPQVFVPGRSEEISINPQGVQNIDESLFPQFSRGVTSLQKPEDIQLKYSNLKLPDYLNRNIINEDAKLKEDRIRKIRMFTKEFIKEINEIVENFLLDKKTVNEMVVEIEECVGPCLKLLESLDFERKSREVREYCVGYKERLKFPVFKKGIVEKKEIIPETKGFKVLDISSFKKNK